jgi:hypothetical protein
MDSGRALGQGVAYVLWDVSCVLAVCVEMHPAYYFVGYRHLSGCRLCSFCAFPAVGHLSSLCDNSLFFLISPFCWDGLVIRVVLCHRSVPRDGEFAERCAEERWFISHCTAG